MSAVGGFTIDIVIVNWNAGSLIQKCLDSLELVAPEVPGMNVIIVDNASTDGSADTLKGGRLALQIVRNEVNVGFAAACNQGAALGTAPRILFLNPDVVIPSARVLTRPIEFLADEGNAFVGICGVQLRDPDGNISRTLSPFPTPLRALGWMTAMDRIIPQVFDPHFVPVSEHMATKPVDSVMGAFLMIRRALFRRLGGFSTDFFVYYEDVDLCKRARNAGHLSCFISDVWAIHEGCGTTNNIRATRYFYSTRSRIIYGLRHFSRIEAYTTALGWMVVDPVVRLLYSLGTLSFARFAETVRGVGMLWKDASHFLRTKHV